MKKKWKQRFHQNFLISLHRFTERLKILSQISSLAASIYGIINFADFIRQIERFSDNQENSWIYQILSFFLVSAFLSYQISFFLAFFHSFLFSHFSYFLSAYLSFLIHILYFFPTFISICFLLLFLYYTFIVIAVQNIPLEKFLRGSTLTFGL